MIDLIRSFEHNNASYEHSIADVLTRVLLRMENYIILELSDIASENSCLVSEFMQHTHWLSLLGLCVESRVFANDDWVCYLYIRRYLWLDQFLESDIFVHSAIAPGLVVYPNFTVPFRRKHGHPRPFRAINLIKGLSPAEWNFASFCVLSGGTLGVSRVRQ